MKWIKGRLADGESNSFVSCLSVGRPSTKSNGTHERKVPSNISFAFCFLESTSCIFELSSSDESENKFIYLASSQCTKRNKLILEYSRLGSNDNVTIKGHLQLSNDFYTILYSIKCY